MNLFCDAHDISQRYADPIHRLERLFLFHGLPCGAPGNLGLLVSALEDNKALRLDLAAFVHALVLGTGTASRHILGEDDLVTLVALASGGPSLASGFGASSYVLQAVPLLRMFLAGVGAHARAEPLPASDSTPDLSPTSPSYESIAMPPGGNHLPPRPIFSSEPAFSADGIPCSESAFFSDPVFSADPLDHPAFHSAAVPRESDASFAEVAEAALSEPVATTPEKLFATDPEIFAAAPEPGPVQPPFDEPPSTSAPPAYAFQSPEPVSFPFLSVAAASPASVNAEPRVYYPLRHSPSSLRRPLFRDLGARLTAGTARARHLASTARDAALARTRHPFAFSNSPSSPNSTRIAAVSAGGLLLAVSALAVGLGASHPGLNQSTLQHVQASAATVPPSSLSPASNLSPSPSPTPALAPAALPPSSVSAQPSAQSSTESSTRTAARSSAPAAALPAKPVPVSRIPGAPSAPVGASSSLPTGTPLLVPDATMRHRLLSARKPVYPRSALLAHQAGSVLLDAFIARDGSVQRVDVVRGDPDFINSAVAAVTWWRYQPFLVRGQPTPVRTEINLTFPAQ